MNQLIALFWARNKEYYRDRGSLVWSFVMPPLIIAVVALAFSRQDPTMFKVGVMDGQQLPPSLMGSPYIQRVDFDNRELGTQKVRHHQIDLLIVDSAGQHYQYNEQSQKAQILRDLMIVSPAAQTPNWNAEAVSGREVRYVDWVIPGVLGMNLMFSGLFGVGYVIVRYRKNGVLKRLQAAPVSPFAFLGAQILSRLIIMLSVSAIVYVACDFFLNFLMLGNYLTLFLIAICGNLCLLSLGLIVASRLANEELANGLLNLITFPMMMLSEVWFSLEGAPEWMVTVSQLLPLTHMVQAARSVMIDGANLVDIGHHLLILVVMASIFFTISARIFQPALRAR